MAIIQSDLTLPAAPAREGGVRRYVRRDPTIVIGGALLLLMTTLAAFASGTGFTRILWRHIVPNTLPPLLVQGTFIAAAAMITEAILSFLGAGTPPNIPSWGNIMAEGRSLFQVAYYIVLFPGLMLSATVLAINLLGDGLRDAIDPRLARRL